MKTLYLFFSLAKPTIYIHEPEAKVDVFLLRYAPYFSKFENGEVVHFKSPNYFRHEFKNSLPLSDLLNRKLIRFGNNGYVYATERKRPHTTYFDNEVDRTDNHTLFK